MVADSVRTLYTNLAIGAAVFVCVLLTYDILRFFFPLHTYHRHVAATHPDTRNYDGTLLHALSPPSSFPFAWIPGTLAYKQTCVLQTHGLDVAMYLRFLTTQIKIFASLSAFTAGVLYATYYTGANKRLARNHPAFAQGIELFSLANVPDRSGRLWVTLSCEVAVVVIIYTFLYRDIALYTERRRLYTAQISNPANYAILIQDIPPAYRSRESIYHIFHDIFPASVCDVHMVRQAASLHTLKQKYATALAKMHRVSRRLVPSSTSFISISSLSSFSPPPSPSSPRTHTSPRLTPQEAVIHWSTRIQSLRDEISAREAYLHISAPVSPCAFVTFRTKRIATFAATSPIWTQANQWHISRACDPRAVIWNALHIRSANRRVRAYVAFSLLTGMAILWAIPSSLIQALGNLGSLAERYPALEAFIEANETFARFLEGVLPPILLFLVLLLIPVITRGVVSLERIPCRVRHEAKARNFLFFFYTMSNFIYVVIIGSALNKVKIILEHPTKIVSLLSTSVPAQATFLIKYVLINAFVGSSFHMLNVGRLLIRPFMLANARTPKQKREADGVFTHYPYGKMYALGMMITLISFVYCTIAPIICVAALIYFCLLYLCAKQTLLYSHRPRYEGGGYLFRDAWSGTLIGLYVHQVSMIGIFSIKRATAQAVLQSVFLGFSVWFALHCRRRFMFRATHGSILDQNEGDETDVSRFSELYMHPGLRCLDDVHKEAVEDLNWMEERKHAAEQREV